jgi:hypothetical protein
VVHLPEPTKRFTWSSIGPVTASQAVAAEPSDRVSHFAAGTRIGFTRKGIEERRQRFCIARVAQRLRDVTPTMTFRRTLANRHDLRSGDLGRSADHPRAWAAFMCTKGDSSSRYFRNDMVGDFDTRSSARNPNELCRTTNRMRFVLTTGNFMHVKVRVVEPRDSKSRPPFSRTRKRASHDRRARSNGRRS